MRWQRLERLRLRQVRKGTMRHRMLGHVRRRREEGNSDRNTSSRRSMHGAETEGGMMGPLLHRCGVLLLLLSLHELRELRSLRLRHPG